MPPLDPAEESLKAKIIRYYHGSDAAEMARVLNTPGPVEIRTSNPALRPLFDSLTALRTARALAHDSVARQALSQMRASLILVASLPDSSAVAVVVRRKTPNGYDDAMILAEDRATPDEYWQAVRRLIAMRRAGATAPDGVDSAVVSGVQLSTKHDAAISAQMVDELRRLRSRPVELLPGIGKGRRIDVFVANLQSLPGVWIQRTVGSGYHPRRGDG